MITRLQVIGAEVVVLQRAEVHPAESALHRVAVAYAEIARLLSRKVFSRPVGQSVS